MIKKTGAALCIATLYLSAANVAFNTPAQWSTLRTNQVTASFVVDSSLIGKQIQLTLTENNGAEKVLATKNISIKDPNNDVLFPIASTNSGGTTYFSLKWKSGEQEGVVAPFAIVSSINTIDPNAIKAVTLNGEPSAASIKSAGATPIKTGTTEVLVGWNPGGLAIAAQGSGVVSINLDADNSKSAFLSFSDRKITVDFDAQKISFSYSSRKAKDNKIIYTANAWTGDMKGTIKGSEAIVTLPWYDLGAKPFTGRQLGFSVVQGSVASPSAASETTPATWGNILLK